VRVREPNALIAPVRFDEGDVETGLRHGYLGTVRRKGRIGQAKPTATAPHLYSTGSDRRILESGRSRNPVAEWPVSAALLSESAGGRMTPEADKASSKYKLNNTDLSL
jgi:hypothetical protein